MDYIILFFILVVIILLVIGLVNNANKTHDYESIILNESTYNSSALSILELIKTSPVVSWTLATIVDKTYTYFNHRQWQLIGYKISFHEGINATLLNLKDETQIDIHPNILTIYVSIRATESNINKCKQIFDGRIIQNL